MNQQNKNYSIIFRALMIITAVLAIFNAVTIVQIVVAVENDDDFSSEIVNLFTRSGNLFNLVLVGSVLGIVLSLLSAKASKIGFVIVRTFMLAGISIGSIASFNIGRIFRLLGKLYNKYGDMTEMELRDSNYESIGLNSKDIDFILDFDADNDNTLYIYLSVIFLAAIIYFIIALTSIFALTRLSRTNPGMVTSDSDSVSDIQEKIECIQSEDTK